jgi:transcriptional regulator with XRE-family HTH domain
MVALGLPRSWHDWTRKPPARGWLRALHEALGMTSAQLAARLRSVPSWITALEKVEATSNTTLKGMRKAAETIGYTFVYAIVPTQPHDEFTRAALPWPMPGWWGSITACAWRWPPAISPTLANA